MEDQPGSTGPAHRTTPSRRCIATLRLLLAGLACVAVTAASTAPAQAATKKERQRICAERGTTVAQSSSARVFEVDRGGNRTLYGCLRKDGRLQRLASWFSCDCSTGDDPAPLVELHARRFVEVTVSASCGPVPDPACGSSSTSLLDLNARRTMSPQGDVVQVVVRGTHVAYADGRVVLVAGDQERVVDAGPGIEDGSLALSPTRLYWTRDGLPYSADLRIR